MQAANKQKQTKDNGINWLHTDEKSNEMNGYFFFFFFSLVSPSTIFFSFLKLLLINFFYEDLAQIGKSTDFYSIVLTYE